MNPEEQDARDLEAVRYCLARACRLDVDEHTGAITITHTDANGPWIGHGADLWEAYQDLLADHAISEYPD